MDGELVDIDKLEMTEMNSTKSIVSERARSQLVLNIESP